ncbi:AIG2-like protein D isoform X1 [Rutidosis leptorrhynchoides]|uniref:AIG2-like protein D isoform X1 n=1 Tax=Rutidosis leptorrhynchoides TaxID=125765 RepID=UPI003A995EA3
MAMTSANSGAVAVGGGGAVFVYGSLLADNVVQLLLNRVPQTSPAILNDYHRFSIKGRVYPAIRPVENKQVTGRVLIGLSATELDILDDYEAEEYDKRVVNVSLLIWDGNFPKFQSVRPYWNESDLQFCWSIWLADFKAASLGDTSEVLQAYTYVWGNSTDPDLYGEWDFEDFKESKLKDYVEMTKRYVEEMDYPTSSLP